MRRFTCSLRVLLVVSLLIAAAQPALCQSSEITYQGQLRQSGTPFTGMADLEFRLYDQLTGGSQVGSTLNRPGVPVEDGLFQVGLDFGASAFDGSDRFLEIRVDGSPLNPRQAVRPSPMALFALAGNEGPPGPEGASPFTLDPASGIIEYVSNEGIFRFDPGTEFESPKITLGYFENLANAEGATVSGGGAFDFPNLANAPFSTVSGGRANVAQNFANTIGGGLENLADGFPASTVGGGQMNAAISSHSTVGGGRENLASGLNSTVGGGDSNTARGNFSVVSGGRENCAGGSFSWAGGRNAKIRRDFNFGGGGDGCAGTPQFGPFGDQGTFMWADSQTSEFISSGSDQFLVRAQGGMALNTNTPRAELTVQSNDNWNPTIGNGYGDLHLGTDALGLAVGISEFGGGAGTVRFWTTGGSDQINFVSSSNTSTLLLTGNPSGTGRVGVGRFPSVNALEVQGNAFKTASGGWLTSSDGRIKTEVNDITGAVDRLMQVRPVTFRYSDAYLEQHPDINDAVYYNVIAQEFAKVFPEAVHRSGEHLPGQAKDKDNEILQVDVHPALMTSIAAVQELAVRLEQAEARNKQLEARNQALEARLLRVEELIGANARELR